LAKTKSRLKVAKHTGSVPQLNIPPKVHRDFHTKMKLTLKVDTQSTGLH